MKKSVYFMLPFRWSRPLWWFGSVLRIYRAHLLDQQIRKTPQSSQPDYDRLLRNECLPYVQGAMQRAHREKISARHSVMFLIWIQSYPDGPEFRRTWTSICRQTYKAWKVHCISAQTTRRKKVLKFSYCRPRIIDISDKSPCSIDGAYHIFLQPGDILPANALESFFRAFTDGKSPDLVYGDHDLMDPSSGLRKEPELKPDWSPELLRTKAYIGPVAAVSDKLLPSGTWAGSTAREWTAEAALMAVKSSARVRRIEQCLAHVPPESNITPDCYSNLLKALGIPAAPQPASPDSQHRFSVFIPYWENRHILFNTVKELLNTGKEFIEEILVWKPEDTPCRWAGELQNLSKSIKYIDAKRDKTVSAMIENAKAPLALIIEEGAGAERKSWAPLLARWADIPRVCGVCPKICFTDKRILSAGCGFGLDSLVGRWFVHQLPGASNLIADSSSIRNVSCLPAETAVYSLDFLRRNIKIAQKFSSYRMHAAFGIAAYREKSRFVCDPTVNFVSPASAVEKPDPFIEHLKMLAESLQDADLQQDPYMHRLLQAKNGRVWLRDTGDPPPAMHIEQQRKAIMDIFHRKPPLAVNDPDAMTTFFSQSGLSEKMPVPDKKYAHKSVEGAAMHLLGLLMQPDTRKRFPNALTDGKQGEFCEWAATAEGLTSQARENIRKAFENMPGDQIRHMYRWRGDVRMHHPLGLTPAGQNRFTEWLFRYALDNKIICTYHIWWFLLEMSESPSNGIRYTYLINPRWQEELPPSARRHLPSPEAVANHINEQFDTSLDTKDYAAVKKLLPNLHEHAATSRKEAGRGVNLLGLFSFPSGLQQCADTCATALRMIPRPLSLRDVVAWNHKTATTRTDRLDLNIHNTTIFMMPPLASQRQWLRRANLHMNRSHYMIGCWYWEAERIPESWVTDSVAYDEIWAPSRFVEGVLKSQLDRPVEYMPPAHARPEPSGKTLNDFGLPEGPYTFYFTFDMCSCMERKNPLALIEAFRLAFEEEDDVQLIIKTMRGKDYPADAQKLKEAAARCPQCVILDCHMPYKDALALMNSADCYCSLHRSEGLGLTMAEAMMLGKPVIATGYSGNVDFMNKQNSFLVPWKMSTVKRNDLPYKRGSAWAEPDVESAANMMRSVRENPGLAEKVAERGKTEAENVFSIKSYAERLDRRLESIQKKRSMS
ncbi:MAG: glycosyltransferase [Verrucomicrobiota bacterium]